MRGSKSRVALDRSLRRFRDRTRLGVSYRTRVHVLLFCEEALAGLPCRSSPYDFELATRRQGLDLTDLSHV